MIEFFFKGLIIGFSIAAPVGPIGILCIRRTITYGRMSGLVSGLGAAAADGFYGFIAGFSLTAVANTLISLQSQLRLFGGFFLCYIGYRMFLSHVVDKSAEASRTGLISDFFSTLALTLANPVTILAFAAVFAGLGLGTRADYRTASFLVSGVITGSATWWLLLSNVIGYFAERVDYEKLSWINRISGGIMISFGIAALLTLL
jgi:threonine/homoserine/homoserine lactone efflux protein